jgi:hypothetical protein
MKTNLLNYTLCATLLLSGVWANAREDVNTNRKPGKASLKQKQAIV